MTKREVKLKVNVEGIVKACQSSEVKSMFRSKFPSERFFPMLKKILDKNLEIEGEYSEEEKEDILNIVKTRIYDCSVYHFSALDTDNLYYALEKENNDDFIKEKAIALINSIIGQNPAIYNPEHGVCRKNNSADAVGDDLSPITCTLEIDDAKFSNLKGMLHFTSEILDRKLLCSMSFGCSLMDDLKVYLSGKTYYTLDELYTSMYKNTDIPLVDYGLKLLFNKYQEMENIIKENKTEGADAENKQKIVKEISNLFISEDLEIVLSIIDNSRNIHYEKNARDYMTQALEYLANDTAFLKETDDGPNILRLKTDLTNFYEDYVVNKDKNLKKLVDKRKDKSSKEVEANPKNATYLLKYNGRKELIQDYTNARFYHNQRFLTRLSPVQQQYLLKKIKELANILNVQVIVADEAEAAEKMEVDEPVEQHQTLDMSGETEPSSAGASARTSSLGKLLVGSLLLLGSTAYTSHRYSKSKSTTAANSDSDNLYHVMDSS
ncbi:hypothetical protein NEMIN01_2316 [Nematocida minor]|uniref:uncharacterized protein n=1 Tax=Nematocida minor TaxID=1912983 RepID=UPI00221FA00C|nr:uncharacterized protein NEMIN01_2316 [Nematocida minor]KAI5192960.1 hypothetical protein NEMIN01_2316 [Nematocida minor]